MSSPDCTEEERKQQKIDLDMILIEVNGTSIFHSAANSSTLLETILHFMAEFKE